MKDDYMTRLDAGLCPYCGAPGNHRVWPEPPSGAPLSARYSCEHKPETAR